MGRRRYSGYRRRRWRRRRYSGYRRRRWRRRRYAYRRRRWRRRRHAHYRRRRTRRRRNSSIKCTGRLVVNNDGLHGMRTRSGSYTLKKGYASISIYYFERGGGAGLYVHWKGPGLKKKPLGGSKVTQRKQKSKSKRKGRLIKAVKKPMTKLRKKAKKLTKKASTLTRKAKKGSKKAK